MQATHPLGHLSFRSFEPSGFLMLSRSGVAERADVLPPVDDPALEDPAWFTSEPVRQHWCGFLTLEDATTADPPTQLRLLWSDEGLFIGARCVEPAPSTMRTLIPADHSTGSIEIEGIPQPYDCNKDDHLRITIDPTHRGETYYEFLLTAAGYARARRRQYVYREHVLAECELDEPADVTWQHRVVVADDAWHACFRLPWSALGLEGPPEPGVVGFNAVRMRSEPEMTHTSWTRVVSPWAAAATDFGDCHLAPARVFMPTVEFGHPVFDWNELALTLTAVDAPLRVRVRVHVEATARGETISDEVVEAELPVATEAGEAHHPTVTVPYFLSWQERDPHAMTIEIADAASGDLLMRTCYRLARSGDVCVSDRFEFDAPPHDPDPERDADDFVTKKRNWLNCHIGRFHRTTTVQGAPSDFCLERTDGRVRFNLMAPDVCRQMAQYIEELFADENDRLCAAALMVHQKVFAMHCKPLTAMHLGLTAESAMRLNGGHCYSRALALAGVMREMRRSDGGGTFDAGIVYVLGHVMVVVRWPDGRRFLFDPTFGSFYFHHDNRRLATERELADDPTLHERSIRGRRANFKSPETHADAPIGRIVWPPGAPVGPLASDAREAAQTTDVPDNVVAVQETAEPAGHQRTAL